MAKRPWAESCLPSTGTLPATWGGRPDHPEPSLSALATLSLRSYRGLSGPGPATFFPWGWQVPGSGRPG